MSSLVQKIVDGESYEFSIWGAKQQLRVLTRLSKMVGEPLAMAFGSMEPGKSKKLLDSKLDMNVIGKVVGALAVKVEEDEVINLLEELCSKTCLCGGKKIDFNMHYQGAKLAHLFRVAAAALEVQYGDFFGDLFASLPLSASPSVEPAAEPTP